VVAERRRKAYKEAKKKGKTLSQAYAHWLAFSFYITNVSHVVRPAQAVEAIYRIRWQVELTFKDWKSLLKIHVLKGTRVERIECLIYGRLICIVVLNLLCSWAWWYGQYQHQREVSFPKLINWLKLDFGH
jgi:IS4 transposase